MPPTKNNILRGMIALEIDEFMHTFCCHPNLVSNSYTTNDAASLATEQCLLSGVAKMLSSAKSDEAMQESTRLSDRVMTLENGLGILRSHPASRMQRGILKPTTLVETPLLSAEIQATHKPSAAAKARPFENVFDTPITETTNKKLLFAFRKYQTLSSRQVKTVTPSEPTQRASTSATPITAPASNIYRSRGTSNVPSTSDALNQGIGGLFGQATLAKSAGLNNSAKFPSVFASTSPFSKSAIPSNQFEHSATSHPRSGLFESPSTNNTSGICSHQPSNLFDYNRETSKPFGGNTPKGTPDSFFPYTDDSRQKKEYFQFIAAYYAYRNMLFEVGLLLYAQEMINAKYLYTNMGSKTTPLAANGQCSYTRDTN
ncbi:hypothetical protein COCVIDRAFT_16289 [Bipolaris victoriae FI3]|uniref:Uncharacterized protein n=1 Tax=Bipolaris victoriae (strain FI3) TaxID=930091 RepID=W7ERM3_BIPV3|nr:hypothetical protein COCVIDRAFT_16289 [Bipolaris victoriae FI3]